MAIVQCAWPLKHFCRMQKELENQPKKRPDWSHTLRLWPPEHFGGRKIEIENENKNEDCSFASPIAPTTIVGHMVRQRKNGRQKEQYSRVNLTGKPPLRLWPPGGCSQHPCLYGSNGQTKKEREAEKIKSWPYPKAPTATVASRRMLSASMSLRLSGRMVAVFRGCLSFWTAEIFFFFLIFITVNDSLLY